MKNKKPINIYGIIAIVLAAALLIGVIAWQFGGDPQPIPTEPSGSSGLPTGSDPTNPNSDPTNPNSNPTDPSGSQPSSDPSNPPAPTDPPLPSGPIGEPPTQPTEPQPTEPKPTEPQPTEPPTQPTEPPTQPTEPPTQPTEPKPTEPPATDPIPTIPLTWETVNETVYAESDVNIRSGPSASYEKLGQLKKGESIKRTAIGSHGWSRVEWNGKEAYISSGYLTTQKPTQETEPTQPKEDFTFVTMYATQDTVCRIGAGDGYAVGEEIAKGTPIAMYPSHISPPADNGYVKIWLGGKDYWIKKSHLSETKDGEPAKDPNNPWSNYVAPADPETGISWDGKSPIIYTYPDGTTGTVPVKGAKYEYMPGLWTTIKIPEDSAGRPAGSICPTCGKVVADSWGEGPDTCHQSDVSHYCNACGKWVNAYTCHDCVEYQVGETRYCTLCGKVAGDGTNGTCVVWMTGGPDRRCEHCGDPCPPYTCHTCKEK